MNKEKLVDFARAARKNSYAPYSSFKVGAALLCDDGEVVTGVNVENQSFGATCCAERSAIFSAISMGKSSFCALAVVGGNKDVSSPCYPCGMCLQVMGEFCGDNFNIYLINGSDIIEKKLSDFLPNKFSGMSLENKG